MKNSRATVASIVIFSLFVALTASAMDTPLRDPTQLWEAKVEQVLPVKTARVVAADYDLIRRDFPEVKEYSNDKIDLWLLRNTAFVSVQQSLQTNVNTPIETIKSARIAYRPREYRRAHVFKVDTGGLIDAKGTGAVDPSGGSHDNGLATLGDMIREYAYEKLVHAIFYKDGRFDTVGSYAVIDYGFDIKHPGGGTSRAGTILRQAHARYHDGPLGTSRTRGQSTMLPRDFQVKVEMFLRQFGITTGVKAETFFAKVDLINLQGATNMSVIDFGSFLTEEKFTRQIGFFYDVDGNATTNDVLMEPTDKRFVQPNKDLHVPFKVWGYSQTGKADSKYDNPYIWAHELAQALKENRATRADVDQHLRNMFDNPEVQGVIKSIHPSCEGIFTVH